MYPLTHARWHAHGFALLIAHLSPECARQQRVATALICGGLARIDARAQKPLLTEGSWLSQIHWPDRYVSLFGGPLYDAKNERDDDVPFRTQLEGLKRMIDAGKVGMILNATPTSSISSTNSTNMVALHFSKNSVAALLLLCNAAVGALWLRDSHIAMANDIISEGLQLFRPFK